MPAPLTNRDTYRFGRIDRIAHVKRSARFVPAPIVKRLTADENLRRFLRQPQSGDQTNTLRRRRFKLNAAGCFCPVRNSPATDQRRRFGAGNAVQIEQPSAGVGHDFDPIFNRQRRVEQVNETAFENQRLARNRLVQTGGQNVRAASLVKIIAPNRPFESYLLRRAVD